MKVLFILLIVISPLLGIYGQEKLSLSLEDCINYTLENNEQIAISRLEMDIADAETKALLSVGLPQVNIKGKLNYNYEIQKSLLDVSNFSSAPPGTEQEVAFGQAYDGNVELKVDQLLFDGTFFVGLKAAKIYSESFKKAHTKTKIDRVEAVSKAYYNSLIVDKQTELYASSLSRLETLLNETTKMYEAGFVEKLDVDRILVNYNNLKVNLNRTEQLKKLNRKLLKYQMGMDLKQPIHLSDNLENITLEKPVTLTSDFDYNQRIEFSKLQTDENLVYSDLQNNRSKYLPNLYASFSYGWNTASPNVSQVFERSRWLNFGVVGVRATIPVFDGFLKSIKIQQNKIQIKQIENRRSLLTKQIDIEIERAQSNLIVQIEELDAQKKNLALAQEVYTISKTKYQEGVGSNLEVINADNSLKEAQTNYLNSLYQLATTQIELKKALGTLYNN